MKYIIDGHNLIPKLGLRLETLDDEIRLVEQLQAYCLAARAQVEVYFDGAPAGQARTRRFGSVVAHFVRQGITADDAILNRVSQLGKAAGNWRVVSSDHRVQVNVRSYHARVLSSEEFAAQIRRTKQAQATSPAGGGEGQSEAEVQEWMRLFSRGKEPDS